MNCRLFLLALMLGMPTYLFAEEASGTPVASGSSAEALQATEQTEAERLMEGVELSMSMARDGEYGRLKGREMDRLESAYAHIRSSLQGVDSVAQLNPQKRQSLALAQSQFDEILKPEDEDRKICKRIASTGTRLGTLECLTVAERRARAAASREMVDGVQRGFCIPGEGRACPG